MLFDVIATVAMAAVERAARGSRWEMRIRRIASVMMFVVGSMELVGDRGTLRAWGELRSSPSSNVGWWG